MSVWQFGVSMSERLKWVRCGKVFWGINATSFNIICRDDIGTASSGKGHPSSSLSSSSLSLMETPESNMDSKRGRAERKNRLIFSVVSLGR